jgi:hypothetical protein
MELISQPKSTDFLVYDGKNYTTQTRLQFLVKDWTHGVGVRLPIVEFPAVRLYHVQAHLIAGRVATCSCEWFRLKRSV